MDMDVNFSHDALCAEGIRACLPERYIDLPIYVHGELDSTNSEARRMVAQGHTGTALLLALSQTGGRGRMGRSFYSPRGAGIYMTAMLTPRAALSDSVPVTGAAAVAVIRAIDALTDKRPVIKWVNDIYLDGKKICGILAEAVAGPDGSGLASILVGIGLNVHRAPMPGELSDIAGALEPGDVSQNALAAAVASELFTLAEALPDKAFLEEYRARSMVLGNDVTYYENGLVHFGRAVDIDDNGGLIVRSPDGGKRVLRSGEISLRLS